MNADVAQRYDHTRCVAAEVAAEIVALIIETCHAVIEMDKNARTEGRPVGGLDGMLLAAPGVADMAARGFVPTAIQRLREHQFEAWDGAVELERILPVQHEHVFVDGFLDARADDKHCSDCDPDHDSAYRYPVDTEGLGALFPDDCDTILWYEAGWQAYVLMTENVESRLAEILYPYFATLKAKLAKKKRGRRGG